MDAIALSILNATLALLVAAGMVCRRRVRASVLFFVYLISAIVLRVPVWMAPETFYVWPYWTITAGVHTLLRFAVAFELSVRALAALPRGRARALLLQASVAAAIVAVTLPLAGAPFASTDGPSIATYGSAWLFAAFVAVAHYHRVPTDPMQRDIAAGFVVWTLVAGLSPQFTDLDGVLGLCRQVLASLLYPAVLLAWAWAAWRPDAPTTLTPDSLAALRPWRA